MYCPYSEEGRDRSSEGAGVGPLARLTSKCNIIDEYSHGLDEMDWYSHCLTDSASIFCRVTVSVQNSRVRVRGTEMTRERPKIA